MLKRSNNLDANQTCPASPSVLQGGTGILKIIQNEYETEQREFEATFGCFLHSRPNFNLGFDRNMGFEEGSRSSSRRTIWHFHWSVGSQPFNTFKSVVTTR
jgi:hypothetical protein